jgi:hypothetical protein
MIALPRRRLACATLLIGAFAFATAGPAFGHVHHVLQDNPHAADPNTEIANGQNHPGFVGDADPAVGELADACLGVAEPANSGPSWYGIETAHHGPDLGAPGRGANDLCYTARIGGFSATGALVPIDTNPAIN